MVEPILILTKVVDKIFDTLLGKASEELFSKLKGDPSKKAFKKALEVAVLRYATGERLTIARPLLDKRGILTDPKVVEELSQLIRFDREPDAKLIGEQWKNALPNPPKEYNFTDESETFLEYLKSELHSTDVFGPVLDSKSLNSINEKAALSTEILTRIESKLSDRFNLLMSLFGNLTLSFSEASLDVRKQIRDYTRLIEEKTDSFVGRKFVFDKIRQFTNTNPRGYFFIKGDPGIGKTALAAQLVKTNGYLHHFNIRAEGINKAEAFLKNVCAQLIAAYKLEYSFLPPDAVKDAGFLNTLLNDISKKLASGEKTIIVVDALDEVDYLSLPAGDNALYLPRSLPDGIYIVVTMQKVPLSIRIECEQMSFSIEQDSTQNITDICEYIKEKTRSLGIKEYIDLQSIDEETFVQHLIKNSQGNFMYLHYVLPKIERGTYNDLSLEDIPLGLVNYYEDHWRRMRGMNEEIWFKYKLPILMALTVVKKPVSIYLIAEYSKIKERFYIREVLREWEAFLYKEYVEYENAVQVRYRMYHDSFRNFIVKKEEISDEKVDIKAAEKKIIDGYYNEIYGEE